MTDSFENTAFSGAALTLTEECWQRALDYLKLKDGALLWALLAIEAPYGGFYRDGRLVIRVEAHKFRQFSGKPWEGEGVTYGALEWAMRVDAEAALRATSFGLPQIMGFNAHLVGYPATGVDGMVDRFRESEDAQLDGMLSYIRAVGIWQNFYKQSDYDLNAIAYAYNGPNHAQNNYVVKLARWRDFFIRNPPSFKVRDEQVWLYRLGYYSGMIDGLEGPRTREARELYKQWNDDHGPR